MHTPWGQSDYQQEHGVGITFYGTPSHGGFKLSAKLNNQIPQYFRDATWGNLGAAGWYEEDCDAAIDIVLFADRFEAKAVADSLDLLAHYLPIEYQRWEAAKLEAVIRD